MYGLRLKYPWKLLLGYLNINSLRNKIKNLRKIKFYLQLNYSAFCETKISPSCNLVKYLITFRLWQPNILFAVGLIIFKIFFLKILTLGGAFWISGSSLFHSIMTDGKKVFLKKLYLTLKWGILFAFLADNGLVNLGIILKGFFGDWPFEIV